MNKRQAIALGSGVLICIFIGVSLEFASRPTRSQSVLVETQPCPEPVVRLVETFLVGLVAISVFLLRSKR